MEDVKIMNNMREVLKKTRKSKKSRHHNLVESANDDSISEILSKKWMFSSPPASEEKSADKELPPKINAFKRLMSAKKVEPDLETISAKKKRKYMKKPKYNKLEIEIEDKSNSDEDLNETTIFESQNQEAFNCLATMKDEIDEFPVNEISHKKRTRSKLEASEPSETFVEATPDDVVSKRKKRKKSKLLDSNENSIPHDDDCNEATPKSKSGRPRRSCAAHVDYKLLESPEKALNNSLALALVESKRTRKQNSLKESHEDDFDKSFLMIDDDDDAEVKKKTSSKPSKLAPVFMKKVLKPAIDPEVKEARRNFLLSELPDDLRYSNDKRRQQFEEAAVDDNLITFPRISHVTQLSDEEDFKTENLLTSGVEFLYENDEENFKSKHLSKILQLGTFTECNANATSLPLVTCDEIKSKKCEAMKHNVKSEVRKLKKNQENFPVNRCFKKLLSKATELVNSSTNENNLLFVDIFKPASLNEFFVNFKPIKQLQKFLLTWNERDKSTDYDSDKSSSRQSFKCLNNFVVVSGKNGCGKTSSIYALANDLNYQVLEINAGTKRNGRKMLQDLLEATQSHRVKNISGKLYATTAAEVHDENESSQESNCELSCSAKSIILIEDAELVFEADDGFVASLSSICNISKRPVILTTNNRQIQHLQKFIQHNEILYDNPKLTEQMGIYLFLLSLSVNYEIERDEIQMLFTSNGHDLRKTINEIEFFIRSSNTRTSNSNLMRFYQRPRCERLKNGQLDIENQKSLSTLCFDSSIVSSLATMCGERSYNAITSYQQRDLMDEMVEFITERCNVVEAQHDSSYSNQKIMESSISGNLISQSTNFTATCLDYSPMLRDICRSEKARCENGRRIAANNRGHYLRFLITKNSLGNDYFNDQCEMFQQ
ncbi:CLUMA_CG016145, isoform A [Clunio marinus]|uniref:CLUMA_CG016145, isoform A n=1 Tax=Clunio marinus TaxID=568069 RepID=A0A1J1IW66_9DIPT|nr:CLUMA_CG016145, isoform A [Clunio marinus]